MRSLLVIITLFLVGCVTISGNRTFENKYTEIQKGISTQQDVIDLLGKPSQVTHPDEDHTVLIYEKRRIYQEHWYMARMKVDIQRLNVFINADDIVTEYKLDSTTDDYTAPNNGGTTVYHPPTYQPMTFPSNTYYPHK